jgi:hypothetical protein
VDDTHAPIVRRKNPTFAVTASIFDEGGFTEFAQAGSATPALRGRAG